MNRVVEFTTRPLYSQVKEPVYSMNRKMGEPQSRYGHFGVEKNI